MHGTERGTGSIASSLAPGTYTCTITDAHGCTNAQIFTQSQETPVLTSTNMQPMFPASEEITALRW